MVLIGLLVWLIRVAVLMLALVLAVMALLLVLMPAGLALMLDYLVMLALAPTLGLAAGLVITLHCFLHTYYGTSS